MCSCMCRLPPSFHLTYAHHHFTTPNIHTWNHFTQESKDTERAFINGTVSPAKQKYRHHAIDDGVSMWSHRIHTPSPHHLTISSQCHLQTYTSPPHYAKCTYVEPLHSGVKGYIERASIKGTWSPAKHKNQYYYYRLISGEVPGSWRAHCIHTPSTHHATPQLVPLAS